MATSYLVARGGLARRLLSAAFYAGRVRPLRILLISTPIGTLGSGGGGGVELTLPNAAAALAGLGHHVRILAPEGSHVDGFDVLTAAGAPPASAQHAPREAAVELPVDSLVGNLFRAALDRQEQFDVIVNFAYDWLGLYLTAFFDTPLLHLVGMGSLATAFDAEAARVLATTPGRIAVHSHAQAATFAFGDRLRVVGNGLDLRLYEYTADRPPDAALGWVARWAPEKGLEDAAAAAARVGLPLRVWGLVEDEAYAQDIRQRFGSEVVEERGFLPTAQLQAELAKVRALLVTPKWEEAFGNVVAEALAVGVPVVAYRRGGPAELIHHGETGFVVEPDSVDGLVHALALVEGLDRAACRRQAEADFGLASFGARLEAWLSDCL